MNVVPAYAIRGLAPVLAMVSLSFLSLLAGPIFGATIHVSPTGSQTGSFTNWESAATNLQAALAIAVSNDEIWVAAGT